MKTRSDPFCNFTRCRGRSNKKTKGTEKKRMQMIDHLHKKRRKYRELKFEAQDQETWKHKFVEKNAEKCMKKCLMVMGMVNKEGKENH